MIKYLTDENKIKMDTKVLHGEDENFFLGGPRMRE